jgi:uncharacterized protein (TIGR02231 family)
LALEDVNNRITDARDAMADTQRELVEARADLAKLVTNTKYRHKITLEVTLEDAGDVDVEFTYQEETAAWRPVYQAHVDTVDGSFSLKRSMAAVQDTGEPWIDVNLSFATTQPSQESAPSELSSHIRRVFEPVEVKPAKTSGATPRVVQLDMMSLAEPRMEAAVIVEEASDFAMLSHGLSLTYDYSAPATLYSSFEAKSEFALEPIDLTPELYVRAVPLYDETGFLVADLINDSGEAILSGDVQLFRDGALIDDTQLQTQADGSEFELAFGAIEGIRVGRIVLKRNEGDRGIISKSNETSSEVRLEVENLTAKNWPVELLDRVSVSEQDDLVIDWTAQPMPDEENVDDKRGVLAWRFELEAGETRDVILEEALSWPEDQILR